MTRLQRLFDGARPSYLSKGWDHLAVENTLTDCYVTSDTGAAERAMEDATAAYDRVGALALHREARRQSRLCRTVLQAATKRHQRRKPRRAGLKGSDPRDGG